MLPTSNTIGDRFTCSVINPINTVAVQIFGVGLTYPGTVLIAGTTPNAVGFRWGNPNLFALIDNAVAVVVGTASDRRLKDVKGNLENSTHTICDLRPIVYEPLNMDMLPMTPPCPDNIGLIADEVELVIPSLVTGNVNANTYQSVNYAGLTPILVGAIKESSPKAFGYVRLRETDGGNVISSANVDSSFNISNISRDNTGLWSVDFVRPMKTTSYAISVTSQGYNLGNVIVAEPGHPDAGIRTTDGFGIRFSGNNINIDPNDVSITVHERQ